MHKHGELFLVKIKSKFDTEVAKTLPYAFAKAHKIVLMEKTATQAVIAASQEIDAAALEQICWLLDTDVQLVQFGEEELSQLIEKVYGDLSSESIEEKCEDVFKDDLLDAEGDVLSIRSLNNILLNALQKKVSDIHFDPLPTGWSLRFRVDGVLQKQPSASISKEVVTRIKVLAQLDIAQMRLPQDGRMQVTINKRDVDCRVSTVPVAHGERIVMRILDKKNICKGLDNLGIDPKTAVGLNKALKNPQGIILITGPTGSGKTTTVYSALMEKQTDSINIMTVEDPIEYQLEGIAQMGVSPQIGLTFAKGLRHILRQDPDVIMVGEIRDQETAMMAIQSSLTGHFVLSTLHTNDAPSAITRLIDMGVEPFLLSSSLLGVCAQRLVRTLCPHCKLQHDPSAQEQSFLEGHVILHLYTPQGCSACHQTGYLGRIGIYEWMPMTQSLQQKIAVCSDANTLYSVAIEEGMSALMDSGKRLIAQGLTTQEEVLRVTREI